MEEKEYQNLADEPAYLHFDFWLNDVEGEALFDCIPSAICELKEEMAESSVREFRVGYAVHIEFLEKLKGKLHNTRYLKRPQNP